MGVALIVLVSCFVIPRVLQGSPEVRASQAVALQVELEELYKRWQLAGGVHGAGEPQDKTQLTQNLLECFTSPMNAPYVSRQLSPRNLGRSGVYEKPSLYPSPAGLRLKGFAGAALEAREGQGVVLADEYGILFDGRNWRVWPRM